MTDPQSLSHLITVHQLRAAGALDCPDWMRKSLGPPPKKTRDLFSDLADDDEPAGEQEPEADDNENSEEE